MGYSDHDSGSDCDAQHNYAREIGETCRACGLQVLGGERVKIGT
jgi:hypothetical protein